MRLVVVVLAGMLAGMAYSSGIEQQNAVLFEEIRKAHNYSDAEMQAIKHIFSQAGFMGQGNPQVTTHPLSREQCEDKVKSSGVRYDNPEFAKICGARFMAPLYDPRKEKAQDAKACIDQFEFPNIPCSYPVTWVRAREAEEICAATGKRLCDAHEWEGACAGALEPHDYAFAEAKGLAPNQAFNKMRSIHNAKHGKDKAWAYGPQFKKGVCAQDSQKSAKCDPSGNVWSTCGTNTYPTGSFPGCASKLEVYDLHGNAAEHMNLPTNDGEMTSRGSKTLGLTEMKGSWFIWDKFQAHQDWCRWRAPYWHGSRVMDKASHHNYHLGFRCCKTVAK